MNFFVKKSIYSTLINEQKFAIEDIIFNNSDIWKMTCSSYKQHNAILIDTTLQEEYIDCSIFPVYDVINLKVLNLIVSDTDTVLFQNNDLYDFITSINQKCHYCNFSYIARPENDGYLIYIDKTFEPFKYKFQYFFINKSTTNVIIQDMPDEILAYHEIRQKVTEEQGILYYLGSPWYVHEYLTRTDDAYFHENQSTIKCCDFKLRTTNNIFKLRNDVRFNVQFNSSEAANNFLNGFYARKFIDTL